MRRAWLVASVFASACASQPPPPCPAEPVFFDVDLLQLAPVGAQRVSASWRLEEPAGETRIEARLLRSDGGLLLEGERFAVPELFGTVSWTFLAEAPAELLVNVRATCGGRSLQDSTYGLRVVEAKPLDQRLPRRCTFLQPISADLLDCDGQVVDVDGGLAPGWYSAPYSWTVRPARWTYQPALGEIGLEPGDGGLQTLLLEPVQRWSVAETFVVLGDSTLVESVDGGLVGTPIDAGVDWGEGDDFVHFCAATSRGGRRFVGICKLALLENGWGPTGLESFWRCELVRETGGHATLRDCARYDGDLVSQDPRTGLVGLFDNREVRWVDLATGDERPAFPLQGAEFHGGPSPGAFRSFLNVGLGPISNVPPRNAAIIDLEAPRLVAFTPDGGVSTTPDLAWSSGPETEWTWLRAP